MATTDKELSNVIINKLTRAQYEATTPDPDQFYVVTDDEAGDGTWGQVQGDINDQLDLKAALDDKASASALTTHTSNTSNPHNVTKAQIGLGSVDNTSDLDKPISTATQTALNTLTTSLSNKADKSTTYTKTEVDGIANTKADKSTTYTKTEVDGLLDNKVDKITGYSLVSNTEIARLATVENYDDTEVRSLIAGKQNTLTPGTGIDITNNVISVDGDFDSKIKVVTDTSYVPANGEAVRYKSSSSNDYNIFIGDGTSTINQMNTNAKRYVSSKNISASGGLGVTNSTDTLTISPSLYTSNSSANVTLTYLNNSSTQWVYNFVGADLQIGGESVKNLITGVNVNGTAQPITNKVVDITIPEAATVDQTYSSTSTSTNALSHKAIADAKFLQNKSSTLFSLSILGTGTSSSGAINIGEFSTVFGDYSVAIGNSSAVNLNSQHSIALGSGAITSASYAIQLGQGTNSEANSLYVGLSSSDNYKLLGSNGLIPDERLSTNIVRTSALSNYVTTNTAQTISNTKTFSANQVFNNRVEVNDYIFHKLGTAIGVLPSENVNMIIALGANDPNYENGLARIFLNTQTTGESKIEFHIANNDVSHTVNSVGFKTLASGAFDSAIPHPTQDTTTSTQIDTVGARNTKLQSYQPLLNSSNTIAAQTLDTVVAETVTLATVAITGSYNDLIDAPSQSIEAYTASEVETLWNATSAS